MINKQLIIFLTVFCFGCGSQTVTHFISKDGHQVVTVIDDWNDRYIIDGNHNSVPSENYVKLYIGDVDRLTDGLYLCWSSGQYEWEIVADQAKIIENKLDTSKFQFSTYLPPEGRYKSSDKKFKNDNCIIYDYYQNKLLFDKGAVIQRE